jgi:hypothetical protein
MCPSFYPDSLDFGSDFAGAVGPTYDPDYVSLPQSPAPGTVLFWGGPASPAGNVTAFITGDAAHFKILSVTAYRVFFRRGPHS